MASGSYNQVDAIRASAKELFDHIYGPDKFKVLQEFYREQKKNIKSVRSLLEAHSPTIQCNNVIGGFKPGETPCWICGFLINQGEQVCEHVLPVAQAKFFWVLYEKGGNQNLEMLKAEYGWAHDRPCNSVKSDAIFLKRVNPGKIHSNLAVDEEKLRDFLYKIKQTHPRRAEMGREWFNDRYNYMYERLNKMASYINVAPALSYLAGVATFMNHEQYDEMTGEILLGEEEIPTIPPRYGQHLSVPPKPDELVLLELKGVAEKYIELLVSNIEQQAKNKRLTFNALKAELQATFEDPYIQSFKDLLNKIQAMFANPMFVYQNSFLPYVAMRENVDPSKAEPFAYAYLMLSILFNLYQRSLGKTNTIPSFHSIVGSFYEQYKADFLRQAESYKGNPYLTEFFNNIQENRYITTQNINIASKMVNMPMRAGKLNSKRQTRRHRR